MSFTIGTKNTHKKIELAVAFTKTYRSFSQNDIYAREAACLEQQFYNALLPIENDDLLAGRLDLLPIGFMPQPAMVFGQGVGYYCDEQVLFNWAKEDGISIEEKRQIEELVDFWTENTTKAKTEALYTQDQNTYMTHGNYRELPGVAYPLYRISGTQLHFVRLMECGLRGLRNLCSENEVRNPAFLRNADRTLALMEEICEAYAGLAGQLKEKTDDEGRKKELQLMQESLERLANGAPKTFQDALQLVHLYTLIAGSINFGRMDEYLTPFYAKGIKDGTLTREQAKHLLKDFWKQMRVRTLTMDARVILGGKGRKTDMPVEADEFAMLVIEVSKEVKEVLPQLTLMCFEGMNPKLWEKAIDCIAAGTTYPILYNDDVNIPAVQNAFSVPEEDAACYVPFGCGEYVLYNKSLGTPSGAFNLLSLLNKCMDGGYQQNEYPFQKENISALEYYKSFDEFYAYFLQEATFAISMHAQQQKQEYDACTGQAGFLLFSMLFENCMEKALPLLEGGVKYLGGTLETYGNTNTADSLVAIKELVYDKKIISPQTLIKALKANFAGYEEVQKRLLEAPKYGNDNPSDQFVAKIHEDICLITRAQAAKVGLDNYLVVVINNRMNTLFGLSTSASADGRSANTYMANANNPAGGMDQNGITALLNSLVKLRVDIHAGAVQNMRFSKEMFKKQRSKIEAILKTYFANGGAQSMISVLGKEDLQNAIKNPDAYRNLIVRVGGFSAKFVDLAPPVQQELLSRTLYE